MPRPFCASFSPSRQSPMYWPPLGHLTRGQVLRLDLLGHRLGLGGLSDEQAACPSVLVQAVHLGDALVAERGLHHRHGVCAPARGLRSATGEQDRCGDRIIPCFIFSIVSPPSALDGRGDRLGTLGIDAHVHAERDRHVGAEARVRESAAGG
jgi:hypothetical protein